jgi:hypothetical protein
MTQGPKKEMTPSLILNPGGFSGLIVTPEESLRLERKAFLTSGLQSAGNIVPTANYPCPAAIIALM